MAEKESRPNRQTLSLWMLKITFLIVGLALASSAADRTLIEWETEKLVDVQPQHWADMTVADASGYLDVSGNALLPSSNSWAPCYYDAPAIGRIGR
jgi:hypothetical protein